MALPKKQLRAKLYENGITDETALSDLMTWIMDANSASLDALREQLDEANETLSALQDVRADNDRLSGELETLRASSGDAAKIQQDFDDYRARVETEKTNAHKARLVRKALLDNGANPDAVDLMLKGEDLSAVEVEGDTLADEEAVVKPYMEAYSAWFGTQHVSGLPRTDPPSGGGSAVTKESIMRIKDHAERQKAIAEHMDLFQPNTKG